MRVCLRRGQLFSSSGQLYLRFEMSPGKEFAEKCTEGNLQINEESTTGIKLRDDSVL